MFNRSAITAIVFVLLALAISCNPAEPATGIYLHGSLAQKGEGRVFLYRIDTTSSYVIDSVNPDKGGAFSFFVETDNAGFYFLGRGWYFSPPFPAFPGDSIQINNTVEKTTLFNGGREAGRYAEFVVSFAKAEERLDSLSKSLENARYVADYVTVRQKADSVFGQIRTHLKEGAVQYIHSNPELLSNILVINSSAGRTGLFEESIDYPLFFEVDSMLHVYHGDNKHVVYFHNRTKPLRTKVSALQALPANLRSGSRAPDIILPGTSGATTKLHHHSAPLTLIYFWNPADISGRKSNKELKLLHEKYKSDGFAVFGVAFDSDVARFKDAVNMDKLWWINVNDTLGLQSPVLETYQVKDFPSLVLMDKKGNISGRFLSVKAFAQWMGNHFEGGQDN